MYICLYIYLQRIYTHTYMYIYLYVCLCVCIFIYKYIYMYLDKYRYIYICFKGLLLLNVCFFYSNFNNLLPEMFSTSLSSLLAFAAEARVHHECPSAPQWGKHGKTFCSGLNGGELLVVTHIQLGYGHLTGSKTDKEGGSVSVGGMCGLGWKRRSRGCWGGEEKQKV